MRFAAVLSSLLVLSLPTLAEAQAGLELTAPVGYQAPAQASPIPPPPSAATWLSSESQPRWPAAAPHGVDPEIVALRVGSATRVGSAAGAYGVPPSAGDESPRQQGPTFGASLGHAAAGFGMGAVTGGAVGVLIGVASCGDGGWCGPIGLTGGVLGGIALAPVGAALGTWGFGEISGGTGNGFAALGGAYLGAGLGVAMSALLADAGEGVWAATLAPALGVVLSMLGAAGGYQLTSRSRPPAAESDESPRTIAMPTLSPTEDGQGATIGAVGTF